MQKFRMRGATKTKILSFAFLAVVSLFISTSAFSQRQEYTRNRVLSVPSLTKGYLGGGEKEDYRISPGDSLEVIVWKELELSRNVRVRPDGKFSYPLLGQVNAVGLTVEELQTYMKDGLLAYVKFPEVTVSVTETAGNTVVVLGEVLYPGVYAYKGTGDVLTAIGLAGDFTRDGKRESVIVISDNFTDHPVARRVNVFKSFYRGTKGDNFLLKPGDIVYVPRTFIADWNKTVVDLQPTLNLLLGQDATNLYNIRTYTRAMYYNRDKPITKQSAD